jgi:ribosomal protein S18 acetylase RimI-like enzyme
MKIQHSRTEHLAEYAQHLKDLKNEDRYTRFGYAVSAVTIDAMILNMLYHQDQHHLFTYLADGHIVGFGHLAREGSDWELAVSVEHSYQGRGIANELMEHMIAWGKVHGVHSVFMHCISDNQRIQHLARKHGLKTMSREGHEITAQVELPRATALDYTTSFVTEQQELAKDIVRLQRAWLKNWIQPAHDHSN